MEIRIDTKGLTPNEIGHLCAAVSHIGEGREVIKKVTVKQRPSEGQVAVLEFEVTFEFPLGEEREIFNSSFEVEVNKSERSAFGVIRLVDELREHLQRSAEKVFSSQVILMRQINDLGKALGEQGVTSVTPSDLRSAS